MTGFLALNRDVRRGLIEIGRTAAILVALLSLMVTARAQNTENSASDLADRSQLTREQWVEASRAHVEKLVQADQFSGTVLLAHDGEILWKAAYGLASKRFSVPNRIDTKFNLGSMNKMFTAVACLQLVENGELFLDDLLEEYLDESWVDLEALERVQVQHLLSHTSGLGSYFNQRYMDSSRNLFRELADYKPLIHDDRPAFRPGTGYSYSNTGMLLAGAVIESASGENYFDYVRANICGVAGMPNTDCYEMDRPVPNLAIGYSRAPSDRGNPPWRNNLYAHVLRGGPAGGGFSTVEDLLAFAVALQNHELLSPQSIELLFTEKRDLGARGYGFGMSVRDTPAGRCVGHSGGFQGINGELRMYRDRGDTIACLSNYDGAATRVTQRLEEMLGHVRD